jgi:dimeric dUTPase (all-alpha-NTP-PPase superfamily)
LKDKLDTIFALQRRFDEDLAARRDLSDITREQWIQKETLAMLSELAELIDEVNFKWWKNPKPVDDDRVKEELVDILHFFVSMCIKMGMDADELCSRYIKKNEENFKRQRGLSDRKGYAAEDPIDRDGRAR